MTSSGERRGAREGGELRYTLEMMNVFISMPGGTYTGIYCLTRKYESINKGHA